jgi:protein associated with RNAse G/E
VFDFTVKIYSKKHIKIIDEDEHEIQKVKLTAEQLKNIPKIGDGEQKQLKKKEKIKKVKIEVKGPN